MGSSGSVTSNLFMPGSADRSTGSGRCAQSKLDRTHSTQGSCSHWENHEGFCLISWSFTHDPYVSYLTFHTLDVESQAEVREEEVTLDGRVNSNSRAILALMGFLLHTLYGFVEPAGP